MWNMSYGGSEFDDAKTAVQTTDGGYIIAGSTFSFGEGGEDIYLIRTNPYGDILWTKTYGSSGDERAYAIQQTLDDGFIIAGYTAHSGLSSADIWIIKTDSVGDSLWTKTYGNDYIDWALSIKQTTDEGFIIAGFTHLNLLSSDVWMIKTDSFGDSLWSKTFGGNEDDWAGSIQQTIDGGFILGGFTTDIVSSSRDCWLIKTDSNGDSLWTKTFGGNSDDWIRSLQQTNDGGYILSGITDSFGAGGRDAWLIRADSIGDSIWTKTYGGTEDDWVYTSVPVTADGGFIVGGGTYSYGVGSSDVWLIKTDTSGEILWTRTYGGVEQDYASCVFQTSDNGFLIAGYTNSFSIGNEDVWIIKTDDLGYTGPYTENEENLCEYNYHIYNYPNPFNPTTTISFSIPNESEVELTIYNIKGQIVKTLANNDFTQGSSSIVWNGDDEIGQPVSSSIYYYKLNINGKTEVVKKCLLLK